MLHKSLFVAQLRPLVVGANLPPLRWQDAEVGFPATNLLFMSVSQPRPPLGEEMDDVVDALAIDRSIYGVADTMLNPNPNQLADEESVTKVTWQYIKSSPKYQALPIPPDTQATIDAAVNAATAQLQMVPLTQQEKAAYQSGVTVLGNKGYLTSGQVNTLVGLSNSIPTP